jgi:hypothetical protein
VGYLLLLATIIIVIKLPHHRGLLIIPASTSLQACLFATLLPLAQAQKLPAKLAAYHSKLAGLPAFKEALEQVGGVHDNRSV